MIDVLLVILIFLMITTTYSKYAELKIDLPQAAGEKAKLEPNLIDVGVDAEGHYLINHKVVTFSSPEGFGEELKRAAGSVKEPVIVISADAGATHQSVINVMEAARLAGYVHITFPTQEKPRN
jgi:biopolymer transport protein ExbD